MTDSAPTHAAASAERVAHAPFVYRLEQFGLIIVWVLLIAVFGYLRPDTFLTWPNFSTILGSQAVSSWSRSGSSFP
jgi:ribose transport system permease protein